MSAIANDQQGCEFLGLLLAVRMDSDSPNIRILNAAVSLQVRIVMRLDSSDEVAWSKFIWMSCIET